MAREEAPNPWLERDEDPGNDGGRASGLLGVDSATLFVDANGAGPYGSDPRKALTDGQGSGVVPGPDHGAGMSSQRNSNGSALNSPTNKDRLRLKSPALNSEKSDSADSRRPTGTEHQSESSMVCQVGGWLWYFVSGGRQCCSMRDRSKDAEAAKRASQTGRPPEYKGEIVPAKQPEFPYPPTASTAAPSAGGPAPMPAIQDGGSAEDGETVSANNSEAMSERKSGFSSYFFLGTQTPTDEAPMKPGNSLGSSLGGIKEEEQKESMTSPHQHHHHHHKDHKDHKDHKVTVKTSRSESSSSGDSLQAMSRDGRESGAMSPTMRPLSARSGSLAGGLLGEDRLSRSRSKSSVTGHSSPLASRAPASARGGAETVIESARAGSNRADSVYSVPDTHRDTHRDTARDSTRTVEEATRSSPLGSPLVGGADSDSDELGATQPLVPRSAASMAPQDRLLEVQPTVSLTTPASPGRHQHHSEASYPAMSHSPSSSSRSVPRHGEMPTQELKVRQAPSSSPFLHSGSASEIPQAQRSADWVQANLAAKNFLAQVVRGVEERRSLVPGDAPPGAHHAQPAHSAYPPHNFSAVSSEQSLFRPQGGEAAAGDGRDDSPSRRRRWRQDNEEARPTADARFPPPSRSQAGSQVGSLAGGWRWPDWAVQFHQPCVEVFVKDEETGQDRWVLGEPQHSVVDPQGNDTFLAVEYLWEEEYYAQEFSPEHIRQPGTRITVRDLLQLQ